MSIFIWLCSDAFVKGWLPPHTWPFDLNFVRFSSFTERMLAVQLLYMYILKKGLTSGRTETAFRLDSRKQASWLFFSIVLNCTGNYCYYICIHCIFFNLFFCLTFFSLYQNFMILFAVGIKGLWSKKSEQIKCLHKCFGLSWFFIFKQQFESNHQLCCFLHAASPVLWRWVEFSSSLS